MKEGGLEGTPPGVNVSGEEGASGVVEMRAPMVRRRASWCGRGRPWQDGARLVSRESNFTEL